MRALKAALWRLAQAVPVALMVVVLNFFLLKAVPGDMADVIAGEAGAATPEFMAQLRSQFGDDQPLPAQFIAYVKKVATFDLGWSFRYNASVASLIFDRLAATLLLMGLALLLAVLLGSALGVVAATTRQGWLRRLIGLFATLGFALPAFWLGLMIVVLFTLKLGWLPSSGLDTMGSDAHGWAYLRDVTVHLVMPVGCLAFSYLAMYIRLMHEAVRDVSQLDFVRTARAKGSSRRRQVWRHVVPNALVPVVTLTGVQFGALLSGSVTLETVFAWPGLGQLALAAVSSRDINLLLGLLFVTSLFVVVVNLLTEAVHGWLDPRIEHGARR
ncbi:ABC transporter permease [Pseudomonas typographi]|uniref:ABC transporter permease n=1 Tax=Pseudomonas typographi TaxID=2715964 RepID=A0ABR7YWX5_9PSED|nr:ABC transporter permease [Pseudomonas typographi]MBD1551266.1 ABC transporter permease [Pseudomonas typographi]MBD1586241.1 ABC transporter permease [Pseudomonas typographi]MBD1597712.1 ABC transporter permease [Pseudomonas typographi]